MYSFLQSNDLLKCVVKMVEVVLINLITLIEISQVQNNIYDQVIFRIHMGYITTFLKRENLCYKRETWQVNY